ncbi:MAG: RNA-binding protein [Crocinitomicaceae bacterium]|nr:RNA-binding protein [Crocinitomicaceae bacterium]|tara:strand:- start:535 stop:777 length:243 start_codon:yes stop_codon:yes gene_type:complete
MQNIKFSLTTEYIELLQLLKATSIVMSGGEAKLLVDDGFVCVNGEIEYRRRRKLRLDDVVIFDEQIKITIIKSEQRNLNL